MVLMGLSSAWDVGHGRGEVCGMFYHADLTSSHANSAREHLIYAESFDPLIREGWQLVPLTGEEAGTMLTAR